MITRRTIIGFAAATLAATGLGAISLSSPAARSARPDCPGRITCPLTGEEICRDECPRLDPARDDCPGQIECPLTGELVCKDRCPRRRNAEPTDEALMPDCCRQ